MVHRIKLMADYNCWPLWNEDEPLGTIDPKTLPLTPETVSALLEWAARYDATLNPDNPIDSDFRSPEDAKAFDQQGINLWHTLQHELGPDYKVRYFSGSEQRLLSFPTV